MIYRIWQGWTTPENADPYESLLRDEIFPAIRAKSVEGFLDVECLRRNDGNEVAFVTIMRFQSWDAVKAFAGEDHEKSWVPDKARALLSRFDQRSRHYERRIPGRG